MRQLRWLTSCSLAAWAFTQTASLFLAAAATPVPPIQFVFTSDAHYGIARPAFRGGVDVPAEVVNRALVAAINAVPDARFPSGEGLRAGQLVGPLDFIVEGGDVTNRAEGAGESGIQSAAASWRQFERDYVKGLGVQTPAGTPTPLYMVPGNHEASNAVGFYAAMTPPFDRTPLVEIFNRMMPRQTTLATFDYERDRVMYARDTGGLHLVFLQIWPDSIARTWLAGDLARVSPRTPVIVFVHDQPESQAKHFKNPNVPHTINGVDKFENLLADTLADGRTIEAPTTIEGEAWERFIRQHPNIKAYFHGNSNWNEFYTWTGPTQTVALSAFRVDSPMKGRFSAEDEQRLSFHVATIDPESWRMTVRECLWNQGPALSWGERVTVSIAPDGEPPRRKLPAP